MTQTNIPSKKVQIFILGSETEFFPITKGMRGKVK